MQKGRGEAGRRRGAKYHCYYHYCYFPWNFVLFFPLGHFHYRICSKYSRQYMCSVKLIEQQLSVLGELHAYLSIKKVFI